jgi:hypothetical protein
MRQYLTVAAGTSRVLLSDVVDRFAGIPWGWRPELETVLLIARLFMAGEIKLVMEGSDLDPKSAAEPLTKAARFKQVSILKRKTAGNRLLQAAASAEDQGGRAGQHPADPVLAEPGRRPARRGHGRHRRRRRGRSGRGGQGPAPHCLARFRPGRSAAHHPARQLECCRPLPTVNPEATAPKASQTVHAAHLSPKTYLETDAEVESYLAALRAKLMAVIQAGQRIRIQ